MVRTQYLSAFLHVVIVSVLAAACGGSTSTPEPVGDGGSSDGGVIAVDPGGSCPGTLINCGTYCGALSSDPFNCGACGRSCGTGAVCTAGRCECASGALMCATGCAAIATDVANCGACGHACPSGSACVSGVCACPGGMANCAGTCTSVATSNNCGACGVTCQGGTSCTDGRCQCPAGTVSCGGTCVSLATDVGNCGACGRACPPGGACGSGVCACPAGSTTCGGVCANLATDAHNCGACGSTCTAMCTGGVCIRANSLSAGYHHTCAVMGDNTVRCWGANNAAQLGIPVSAGRPDPVTVPGLSGVAAVAAGGGHTCAMMASGAVACWGEDNYGQLGDGAMTTALRPVPANVPGIATAATLTAGLHDTCVRSIDGTAHCWGHNDLGQLGDGTAMDDRPSPTSVLLPMMAARDLYAGYTHTCAQLANGTVWCWGDNSSGQVGDGTMTNRAMPSPVMLPAVQSISAKANHTCALLSDGSVRCWGQNDHGQLGNGFLVNSPVPVAVTTLGGVLTGVAEIAVGGAHTCARMADATVQCWGNNDHGQLGDGTLSNRSLPVRVSGLTGVAALVAGHSHTCARMADGTVQCWGANADGQLGNRSRTDGLTPGLVTW